MTAGKTFGEYIQTIVDQEGTDRAIGAYLGFTDGSRVGQWRKGLGRPSELAVVKLARWRGDDPIRVLRLAGYLELADLLAGHVREVPPRVVTEARYVLGNARNLIAEAIDMLDDRPVM